MSQDYWLTVRTGPKVARERFDTLDDALEELEARAARLTLRPRRETIDVKVRQFAPEVQVAARLEARRRRRPRRRLGAGLRRRRAQAAAQGQGPDHAVRGAAPGAQR
jgi:hypothetical protein